MSVAIYLINLDDRKDRLSNFSKQAKNYNLNFERLKAAQPYEIDNNPFVEGNVAACWVSHQRAAQKLIDSEHSHAVILEDDAVINRSLVELLNHLQNHDLPPLDLLQLGYLTHKGRLDFPEFDPVLRRHTDLRSYVGISLARYDVFFRFWIRATRFLMKLLSAQIFEQFFRPNSKIKDQIAIVRNFVRNEYELRKILGLKAPLIYHSFEPGTHCYLINRYFAEVMVQINNPVYLAADLMLMSVAKSHNFKVIRVGKSMVNQSNSPSSISRKS
jgi:GR25 family glycosyltransferase involved in LPS biosynthesis